MRSDGIHVAVNTGYGFTGFLRWTGPSGFESGESYSGSLSLNLLGFAGYFKDFAGGLSRTIGTTFPRYAWVDVNGDGILDALHKGTDEVHVGFGSGSGVLDGVKYGNHGHATIPVVGGVGVDPAIRSASRAASATEAASTSLSPSGPCAPRVLPDHQPGCAHRRRVATSDVDLVDMNGDGYADSVSREDEGGSEDLVVGLNRQGRTGLLESVENPLHGRFALEYGRRGQHVAAP